MFLAKKLCLCVLLLAGYACAAEPSKPVYFSPADDCEQVIVQAIDAAEKSVHYQLYNFTSQPVAEALQRAAARGCEVIVLLDYHASHQPKCQAAACAKNGCQVFLDSKHPIAHNKVRIIDGKTLLAGSYNDSAQAHYNAENLTVSEDPALVSEFEGNFQTHLEHALTWRAAQLADKKKEAQKATRPKRVRRKAVAG